MGDVVDAIFGGAGGIVASTKVLSSKAFETLRISSTLGICLKPCDIAHDVELSLSLLNTLNPGSLPEKSGLIGPKKQ